MVTVRTSEYAENMPSETRSRSSWYFIAGLSVVVMIPALMALVAVLTKGSWYPAGDMAQAELHMRGFFSHPPLVGAAGRIVGDSGLQGSHPGPGLWVAMLPVYVLGGRSSAALMVAVVSVHAVSVAAALHLARRRGGKLLACLVAAVLVLHMRSAGPDFLIEPWNPWLAVFAFLVFVFLIGEIVAPVGERFATRRLVIATTLVGSYCIQCHAGYSVLVGGLLGCALISLWLQDRKLRAAHSVGTRSLGAIAIAFGCALFVAWLPPLLDQWRRDPGNLTILWQHFGSPSEPTIALRDAVRVIATQANVLGPWLTQPGANAPSETWAQYLGFFAFCGLWLYGTVSARKAGLRSLYQWQLMLGLAAALGIFSVMRIFGPYYEYTIRWFWIIAGLIVVSSIVAVTRSTKTMATTLSHMKVSRSSRLVVVMLALVVVAQSSWQIVDETKKPGRTESDILAELVPQLSDRLSSDEVYLLKMYDAYTLDATGFGTVLELERRGFTVGVESFRGAAALPHRIVFEEQADEVLWIVVGPAIERANLDPDLTQLAYANPRSGEEEKRAQVLLTEIARQLRLDGRDDLIASLNTPGASLIFAEPPLSDPAANLVRELLRLGQPVAVYSVPPGTRVRSLE